MKIKRIIPTNKRFTSRLGAAVLCLVLVALANSAQAVVVTGGTVPDRSTLDSILAPYGPVTENFEALNVLVSAAPPVLNYNTPVYGFGSGLVVPGVTFQSLAGDLQWNPAGYYGLPSEDIGSTSDTIEIDFSKATPAFGLDLLVFAGYGDSANVDVYGTDNTTLLASFSGISISDPSSPVFFGYQNAAGIGMVQIQGIAHGWSPLIDNVTFAVAPEPSTMSLAAWALGIAALARRLVAPHHNDARMPHE